MNKVISLAGGEVHTELIVIAYSGIVSGASCDDAASAGTRAAVLIDLRQFVDLLDLRWCGGDGVEEIHCGEDEDLKMSKDGVGEAPASLKKRYRQPRLLCSEGIRRFNCLEG